MFALTERKLTRLAACKVDAKGYSPIGALNRRHGCADRWRAEFPDASPGIMEHKRRCVGQRFRHVRFGWKADVAKFARLSPDGRRNRTPPSDATELFQFEFLILARTQQFAHRSASGAGRNRLSVVLRQHRIDLCPERFLLCCGPVILVFHDED